MEDEDEKVQDEAVDTTGLVLMRKDAEELCVHPSCVKAHEEAGWAIA